MDTWYARAVNHGASDAMLSRLGLPRQAIKDFAPGCAHAAPGFGDLAVARPPQHPNGGIAKRHHHLRNIAATPLRAIFIERDIAYPMRTFLNRSLSSDQLR